MQHPSLHPKQDGPEHHATPTHLAVAAGDGVVESLGRRNLCRAQPDGASPNTSGAGAPWRREAEMAVIDKLEAGADAGLGGATWGRDQALEAQVRGVLARRDVAAFAGLMQSFGELVEDSGPLGYLRFEEGAFGQQVAAGLHALSQGPLRRDAEALCEALHLQVIPQLCPQTFLRQLRDELRTFMAQSYVPRTDRLASCAALLTLGSEGAARPVSLTELPALYAIFRAQLLTWLEQAGRRQEELLRLALALRGDS